MVVCGLAAKFWPVILDEWCKNLKLNNILVLAGDGIGPEVMASAEPFLRSAHERFDFPCALTHASVGGTAIDQFGTPLPQETLALAQAADAVLLGAVGGPKWEALPMLQRPERGLLGLRSALNLFANVRPAILYPQLAAASSLKPELVAGLDIVILRELTGDIYFGQPRGVELTPAGKRRGFNTAVYDEDEIARIARVGFELARKRQHRLCSVDKANVLEVTQLWRDVVIEVGRDFPDVALSHMYVDNAAMQLVRAPKQFDVIVTGNMFGDILSDAAAMLTGSLGMLPSASLDANAKGMYEPVHGSAPDIAGQGIANPLATLLSVAMMWRYTFAREDLAGRLERAVSTVLDAGLRTRDIAPTVGEFELVGTEAMAAAVLAAFLST